MDIKTHIVTIRLERAEDALYWAEVNEADTDRRETIKSLREDVIRLIGEER